MVFPSIIFPIFKWIDLAYHQEPETHFLEE
jgi:hypothetical protein